MCVQFFAGFFLCCCQYLTSRSHAVSIHLHAYRHLSGQVFDKSASDLCSSLALFTLDTRAPIHQRMVCPLTHIHAQPRPLLSTLRPTSLPHLLWFIILGTNTARYDLVFSLNQSSHCKPRVNCVDHSLQLLSVPLLGVIFFFSEFIEIQLQPLIFKIISWFINSSETTEEF